MRHAAPLPEQAEKKKAHSVSVKREAPMPQRASTSKHLRPSPHAHKFPHGVPAHFHPMYVDPKLAEDFHKFYGPEGLVIPHDFAPAHAQLTGASDEEQNYAAGTSNVQAPQLPAAALPEMGAAPPAVEQDALDLAKRIAMINQAIKEGKLSKDAAMQQFLSLGNHPAVAQAPNATQPTGQGLAAGTSRVNGPNSPDGVDTVPANLTKGEAVLNKGAMQLPGARQAVDEQNRAGLDLMHRTGDGLQRPPPVQPIVRGGGVVAPQDPRFLGPPIHTTISPPQAGGGSDPVALPPAATTTAKAPRNQIPAVNQGYFSTTGSLAKLGAQSQAAFNSIPAAQRAAKVAHKQAIANYWAQVNGSAASASSASPMGRHGAPTPTPTPGIEPSPIPGNIFPTPTPSPDPTVPPDWNNVTAINAGEPTVQINPDEGPFNDAPPSDTPPGSGVISPVTTTTSTPPSGVIIPRDQFGNPVTGRVAVDQYGNRIAGTRAPGTRGGAGGFVGVGPPGGGPTGFGQQPGGGWLDAPMSPGTPGNMFPLYFGSGGQAGRTMSAAALN